MENHNRGKCFERTCNSMINLFVKTEEKEGKES